MHDELLRRLRNGHDPEALAGLFELDQAGIYHFMNRRLGHRQDAEDATQEVFRRVLLSVSTLRDPRGYRGWLYQIALRVAQTQIQARIGERHRVEGAARTASIAGSSAMDDSDSADRRARIKAAVDALEEDLRAVVLLRYEQGLSYEEIAEATQRPMGTVSKRLHTAHQKLQQALATAGLSLVAGALELKAFEAVPESLAARLKQMALEASPRLPAPSIARWAGITAACFLAGLFVAVPLIRKMNAAPSGPSSVARPSSPDRSNSAPASPSSTVLQNAPSAKTPEVEDRGAAQPGTIRGFVRDQESHAAIAGAAVWLELRGAAAESTRVVETTTGPDGTFCLQAPAGKYTLDAIAPGYVIHRFERMLEAYRTEATGETEAEDEAAEAIRNSCEVQLDSGSEKTRTLELASAAELRGVVVDQQGLPVPESPVALTNLEVSYTRSRGAQVTEHRFTTKYEPDGRSSTFLSDLQGRFTISNLYPKGQLLLTVTRPGYQELEQVVALERKTVEVTLVLERGSSFGGRVLSGGGQPVAEACLFLLGAPGRKESGALLAGKDGSFEAADQAGGARFVAAFAPGYAPRLMALANLDPGRIPIVLSKSAEASVTGLITDELGEPLQGASVVLHHYELSAAGGRADLVFSQLYGGSTDNSPGVFSVWLPDSYEAPRTKTQADGAFRLEKLAPASGSQVFLEIRKQGYESLVLEAGAAGSMQIKLRKN